MKNETKEKLLKIGIVERLAKKRELKKWEKQGRPVPPPHVYKEKTVGDYARKYGCRYFVETGTYLGDMVRAQLKSFQQVLSVELSEELYHRAEKKFFKNSNVHLYQGDSAMVLPQMVNSLPEKEHILFWLDGHYSSGITACGEKETPIIEEIDSLLGTIKNSVILIDDARSYVGKGDYPSLDYLENYVKNKQKVDWEVKDDIIRIIVI